MYVKQDMKFCFKASDSGATLVFKLFWVSHTQRGSLFMCFLSYFLGFSYRTFVSKVGGGGCYKILSPKKLWKHVVTEYKVGGYSFKIMRANGDKQPTDSLQSRSQTWHHHHHRGSSEVGRNAGGDEVTATTYKWKPYAPNYKYIRLVSHKNYENT